MRKPIIALGTFLGGITYAAVWTKILDIAFNYREIYAEVVGEQGTGIAYITSWNGAIYGGCFEYQGKKAELTRWASGRSCKD